MGGTGRLEVGDDAKYFHESEANSSVSICLVIAYFGRWPAWIDYYLASCAANPEIHWLIFTDAGVPGILPGNVFVQAMTIEELDTRASRTLGYPIQLRHPYKVCDLKPAYGEIFADELQRFSYWGYTDLDIVYGQLRRFLDLQKFTEADVFTAAPRLVVGHFTLFRNVERLNTLYRRTPGLQQIVQHYECQAFDEKAFADLLFCQAESSQLLLKRSNIQLDDSACLREGRTRFVILWWRGRLFDVLGFRELAYYHFIQTKYRSKFCVLPMTAEPYGIIADQHGLRCVNSFYGAAVLMCGVLVAFLFTIAWYFRLLYRAIMPKFIKAVVRALLLRVVRSE